MNHFSLFRICLGLVVWTATFHSSAFAGPSPEIKISFDTAGGNALYFKKGLPVPFLIENLGKTDLEGHIRCAIRTDRLPVAKDFDVWEEPLNLRAGSKFSANHWFKGLKPGFYRVGCTVTGPDNFSKSQMVVLGFKPDELSAPLTLKSDFNEFWDLRRAELKAVKPDFKIERDTTLSTSTVDVFSVEMRSHGGIRVRGWYTVPKKAKKPMPALLAVPGYTMVMKPNTSRTNIATFSLDPRGHGRSKVDYQSGPLGFMFTGLTKDPLDYVYTGVYMDCLRAIDFLASRPEVDRNRIGVEGASQGGGLSMVTAALDPRVMLIVPSIPWLCDWVGYNATNSWQIKEFPIVLKARHDLTKKNLMRILSYVAVLNFASGIKCPVFMNLSIQDPMSTPRTIFNVYNRINSEKAYLAYPKASHWIPGEHYGPRNKWISDKFGVDYL